MNIISGCFQYTTMYKKRRKYQRLYSERPMIKNGYQDNSQRIKQYTATISVSLGAVCAGSVLAWSSPALPQMSPMSNNTNATEDFERIASFTLTKNQEATVGAMVTVGALLAALPAGFLADRLGRKSVILAIAVAFVLNWFLIIFASGPGTVIVGRFFAGVGLGGICVTAPMYIGEIAEDSMRGVLGSFFQIFLSIGILITCIIGSITNYVNLSIALLMVPIALGVSFAFMPETPIFLAKSGRIDQAESNLRKFRGNKYNIEQEMKAIQQEISESQEHSATFKDLLTSKGNLRALVAVLGVMAYQQLCGINAVVFYTVPIFKAAGSTLSPSVAAIIISVVQCVGGYIAMLIIEKANRKFYLMLSSTVMFLCLSALGLYFHLQSLNITSSYLGFVPIGSSVLFMLGFTAGYGAIPWMLMSELFAPELKGIGSGLAIVCNWICAFIVTFSFPNLVAHLGSHVTFYIFALATASGTVFVNFFVPETRGKTLLQIQEELNR